MKKLKVLLIFALWILLGRFVRQIKYEYTALHQPLIQEGKINIDGLIRSIGQVVNPGASALGDTAYQRLDAIYSVLQSAYYDQSKLQSGLMIEDAVKGFVDGIDDPYTVYMDSTENSWFNEEIKGQTDFEGIWAVVSKIDYYVQIEEVLKWSPAAIAGLMPLDRIISIDSWSVKDLDVNGAVAKIRWPKGTQVTITLERIGKDGSKTVLQKVVTRDKLSIPSVTSEVLTWAGSKNIWYINISIIGEETENLLKTNILSLKKQSIQWVILDLRGNGGGLISIASEIVSHFLPKWSLIVSTRYRTLPDEKFYSEGYGDLQWLPVIVLVDGGTASAGEIIALALQEWAWAKIVGTQTFGKWSIQTIDEFTDGASLKYTIGRRYAPSGKTIDKVGIAPDVVVTFDTWAYAKDNTDNQLEKAKSLLN